MQSLHAIRWESGKDTGENGLRVGIVDADDVGVGGRGFPAVKHAEGGEAGEDADERHTGRGGRVLAGGIVAYVEGRGGDDLGEAGEGAVPVLDVRAGAFYGAFDAGGFGAAGA